MTSSVDPVLEVQQLRERLRLLEAKIESDATELQTKERRIRWLDARIEKLSHEMAVLRRWKFGGSRESLNTEQLSLIDEAVDADLAAIEVELSTLRDKRTASVPDKQQPKREPLPESLVRTEIRHEPESTLCATTGCGAPMQRVGEDITEKLDYEPGQFSVQRHVRGKWVCRCCERLVQEPMPPTIIDKGIPTTALLAHVLVSKYQDHVPLARQQTIFARSGVRVARSTLAEWVGTSGQQLMPLVDALRAALLECEVMHADETPVQMLKPEGQRDGKTHRAYLWAYASGAFEPLKAVVYDFCETRAGANARRFLQDWTGSLLVDEFSGYQAMFKPVGAKPAQIIELGCMAHARRKFYDLFEANKSQIAASALVFYKELYEVEREAQGLSADDRLAVRQARSATIIDAFHRWLLAQRGQITNGTATAKAIDYNLRRWPALTRFLVDGQASIDNNWVENQIRPIALRRRNWLFAGSLRAGQRAAAVMSLVHSARINGLDPHAYLRDVLERLPTHKMADIAELLPHRWKAQVPLDRAQSPLSTAA